MKKILLAVTAALAITGCSQNEEFENAGQNAVINFESIVSNATRATEMKLDELKTQGFHVYALLDVHLLSPEFHETGSFSIIDLFKVPVPTTASPVLYA